MCHHQRAVSVLTLLMVGTCALAQDGPFFQTDLEVASTGAEETEVVIQWLPRGEDNLAPVESDPIVLAPGHLGPYSNAQLNRVLGDWAPVDGYVDVWADREDALYACYGSVLDNLTSDPTTVLPR